MGGGAGGGGQSGGSGTFLFDSVELCYFLSALETGINMACLAKTVWTVSIHSLSKWGGKQIGRPHRASCAPSGHGDATTTQRVWGAALTQGEAAPSAFAARRHAPARSRSLVSSLQGIADEDFSFSHPHRCSFSTRTGLGLGEPGTFSHCRPLLLPPVDAQRAHNPSYLPEGE